LKMPIETYGVLLRMCTTIRGYIHKNQVSIMWGARVEPTNTFVTGS